MCAPMDDAGKATDPKNSKTLWRKKLMKKFLLGTVALVALGATVPALAADLPARTAYTKAPAYVAPLYNWTGLYIGGHIGGAFNSNNNFGGLTTGNNNDARFLGGFQVGGDYQFAPNWVIGLEGQYSFLSNNNNGIVFPGGSVYTNNQRALGSVAGRIGYTWGPALLYVKGGYAYSDNNESVVNGGVPVAFAFSSGHRDGYTVGGGLEYMFAPNWSAKIEYQYYNFGSSQFVTPVALAQFGSFTTDDHVVRAGVNYRFNWGAPVVAKY
jgi:outer membrane immunogenic protein